jgi:hypothetical protein
LINCTQHRPAGKLGGDHSNRTKPNSKTETQCLEIRSFYPRRLEIVGTRDNNALL